MGKCVLSVVVEDKLSVIGRVLGFLKKKGYRYDRFSFDGMAGSKFSRIMLSLNEENDKAAKIKKQLSRLADVVKVEEIQDEAFA